MTYDVMDGNEGYVISVAVDEAFCCFSTNTCNNGYASPTKCATYPSGTFVDTLSIHCNSVGGSCGYTMTQQLHWCPAPYLGVAIATLYSDGLYSNKTVIYGYARPGTNGVPTGTDIFP
jgi:hypothetical protein